MRINHKSDFDFRLDLYAADPYGTAVASGFPDCDFTGKLFIGPTVRSRQCYTFSKSGKSLVNCFDNDGHLHVVVSDHNLAPGPLYCELTLRVPDSHYPGGFRSAVYSFPLNLYLTDNDAELISPTVSVTLPVMQRVITQTAPENDPLNNDANDVEITSSNRALSWLSPRVCAGHFRTGAYVGNFYRNHRGRIYLSGHKVNDNPVEGTMLVVHIHSILNLGIEDLSIDNLISMIKIDSPEKTTFTASIEENKLLLHSTGEHLPGYYLDIPKSEYATINRDGAIKYYSHCPIFEYKPQNVTLEEVLKYVKLSSNTQNGAIYTNFPKSFILQNWRRQKNVRAYKEGMNRFTIFVKPKIRFKNWFTKNVIFQKVNTRPLFFRVARKKHGAVSDWLYFKILCSKDYIVKIILTDETGSAMTDKVVEL